ncbi:hypothetical protein [Marinobacter fonticola]|uniref:hypothetical protein n=1 Tax=Marinobacter fonticola TaxID=2603215 RepID=UPI0011E844B1|nr:hypothetical protein [Marinobacter fonticola]
MTKLSYCLAFSLPAFLIGCGGGGGGSSDDGGSGGGGSASTEACRSIDELSGVAKATGRYKGALTMNGVDYNNAYAFVGPDGKFRLIAGSDDTSQTSYIAGQFEGDASNLADSDATAYFVNGNDASNETANVAGNFEAKTQLVLNSADSLAIDADLKYVAPPSGHCMESGRFANTYSDTDNGGVTSLNIDSAGDVTGTTIRECVVSGRVDSYNVEGGLFFANLDLANCNAEGFNGPYQAIGGFVFDPSGTGQLVDMIIENDEFALYSRLNK